MQQEFQSGELVYHIDEKLQKLPKVNLDEWEGQKKFYATLKPGRLVETAVIQNKQYPTTRGTLIPQNFSADMFERLCPQGFLIQTGSKFEISFSYF